MNCPLCGTPGGYLGLDRFECTRPGCKNYKAPPPAQFVCKESKPKPFNFEELYKSLPDDGKLTFNPPDPWTDPPSPDYDFPVRIHHGHSFLPPGVTFTLSAPKAPAFDPMEWAHCPEHAALKNVKTGQFMGYGEWAAKTKNLSPDLMEKVRLNQRAMSADAYGRARMQDLMDLGKAAGWAPPGEAFPIADLVNFIKAKLAKP